MGWSMTVTYFIIFGDICHNLVGAQTNVLLSRQAFSIGLGIVLLREILKKDLKELKNASYILFIGVITFILILLFKVMKDGKSEYNTDTS